MSVPQINLSLFVYRIICNSMAVNKVIKQMQTFSRKVLNFDNNFVVCVYKYWRTPRGVLALVSAHARTLNPPPLDLQQHRQRRLRKKIEEKKEKNHDTVAGGIAPC
jgi:hypothetical protein